MVIISGIDQTNPDNLNGIRGFLDEGPGANTSVSQKVMSAGHLLVIITADSLSPDVRNVLEGRIDFFINL